MAGQDDKKKKGTFSNVRLPIAQKYIYPFSRKRMMQIGGIVCLALALYVLINAFFQKNSFFSEGPLSANHANFETDCARCHESFKSVDNAKCSVCHEKANTKLGVYSFATHYLYRSGDNRRITNAQQRNAHNEMPCLSCHPDHLGRNASITQVPDSKCVSCHEYGSFNKNHPQFGFVRNNVPHDSTLVFTHIKHTREVLKKAGSINIESACLYCHRSGPDGKHFMPVNFDAHCADCHQPVKNETPALAVVDPGNPAVPGVETLQMIQSRRAPGTFWSFYTNPNEFAIRQGTKVVKSPVYHKDPWILENLKLIRKTLYTEVGLTDLLNTIGGMSMKSADPLYREALMTLRGYINGLRGRPESEVQMELAHIDTLLRGVKTKIGTTSLDLSASAFSPTKYIQNPALTVGQINDLEDFALKVAKPCLDCHIVEHAAILRVNPDQRVLDRAEFNHRAHILQRRCLECHTEIPVNQVLVDKDTSKALLAMDRSSVQNIPKIENCFQCHTPREASTACVTCHEMHPNKDQKTNLQLFVGGN